MIRKKIEQFLEEELQQKVMIEKPPAGNGDYASNVAFITAKKENKNPNQVAEEIAKKIKSDLFSKIEAKNGFLNFFLSEQTIKEELFLVLKEKEDYGKQRSEKTVVIDYSSPNVAKPFGIGHLRSTIIGQAIYNIYQFSGWKTVGVNHLGDWGTQYGKIIYQLKKEDLNPEELSIKELEQVYVRFHQEAEKNPEIEEQGREWFHKLEQEDEEAGNIWRTCKEKSIEEFNKVYERLGVEIDHTLGESFYQDKIKKVVEEVIEKKVAVESKNAFIVEFEDMPPAMILKSDKSTTYLARDLAAVKYRLEEFSPDLLIYEVGAEQSLHMKQLFATVEKLGWAEKEKFVHMAHGLFRFKDGKFSTRKGKTIHLEDVLSVAEEKAEKILEESLSNDMTPEEKKQVSKIVALGAVKYNGLKNHHRRDVVFDWDTVLALKGDSGPYLQYTCVRCKRILEKAESTDSLEIDSFDDYERKLMLRIIEFKEAVEQARENFSPNIIAEYGYKLSKDFNLMYEESRILENKKRIAITKATYMTLSTCLSLLSIQIPERM
jgi:arginyl-tRNA synthetase